MQIKEAIGWLKEMRKDVSLSKSEKSQQTKNEAIDMAIEALDKQIPKPFIWEGGNPVCPVCGEEVWDMEWCNYCGQMLYRDVEDNDE